MSGYRQDLTCSIGATQREQREQTAMTEHETIDDGGPAFPTYGSATQIPGMSLLDHFAGRALSQFPWHDYPESMAAAGCYKMAIAMLNERERINAAH